MNEVKFSRNYDKLSGINDGDEAVLVHANQVDLESMVHEQFRHYDTLYHENGKEGHYPLPEGGDFLLLIFYCAKARKFFTTLRRYTMAKAKWYAEGKRFIVRIQPIGSDVA